MGVALGGVVAILNFRWLWRIFEKIIFENEWLFGLQIFFKFLVLVAVIFLILRFFSVSPVAFVVGTTALVAGILFEGIRGFGGNNESEH